MELHFESLDDSAFGDQFSSFSRTAFRLETMQVYNVAYEEEDYLRFLAGMPRSEPAGITPWVEQVRAGIAGGKSFQRVHVIREPLTDYIRFECAWCYRDTVAAGEDVRVIPLAGKPWPAGVPEIDFWLFDATRLTLMAYASDGSFRWGEFTDEASRLEQANAWREEAVRLSQPFSEYDKCFDDQMLERST